MGHESMSEGIELTLRWQKKGENELFNTVTDRVMWNPKQTAAVICDMWDQHWCRGASARVEEMAPHLNEVVKKLRQEGVLIIHAPSDTLDFYKNHPARLTALSAPHIEMEFPLQDWVRLDPEREGEFPIDDSDGGCGCVPRCSEASPWSRQHGAIAIHDEDAVTDSFEAFYLMKQRGIQNVMIMGVHTNMCVLGRPFGIRQLVRQGFHVILLRDLTDTMYNPNKSPFVDHFRGTDIVISHIEKYWCPTISSNQIIGGMPFRFQDDHREKK